MSWLSDYSADKFTKDVKQNWKDLNANNRENTVQLSKGGSPGQWQSLSGDERWELFKEAGINNQWLGVSFQSNSAFTDVIEHYENLLQTYRATLEAGKTLMYANRTLALAYLNPIILALEQLIVLVENTINDIMGSGIYVLPVNTTKLNKKHHKVSPKKYDIKFNRLETAELSINPFTNTLFFHCQPIEDIHALEIQARRYGERMQQGEFSVLENEYGIEIINPHKRKIDTFKSDPNILFYNGRVWDKTTQSPVYEEGSGTYSWPSEMINKITSPFRNVPVCPPSKLLKIMNDAFDDKNDLERPIISDNGRAGALIMIAGTSDPAKILSKVAKLYNYFASFGPIKDLYNTWQNVVNTDFKYRTETIIVENLCAPNPNNLPHVDDWPFQTGEDANLLATRNSWKIGHNSDNVDRYGSGITEFNKHKVLLKNLRTGEVMQIIGVKTAKKIDVASSAGANVRMISDSKIAHFEHGRGWISSGQVVPAGDDFVNDSNVDYDEDTGLTGINVFNINSGGVSSKTRYRQEITVMHNDFFINTKPGDVLVEVEVSGFHKVEEETKSANANVMREGERVLANSTDARLYTANEESEGKSFTDQTTSPIFTLKNGTPNIETETIQNAFTRILLERRLQNNQNQQELIEAYLYYSNKIEDPEYFDDLYRPRLTYFKEVTEDEKKSILSNQKKEIDKLMGVPDLVPANQGLWFDNEAESFLYNMFLELERHYPRTEAESKIWTKIYTTIKTLSTLQTRLLNSEKETNSEINSILNVTSDKIYRINNQITEINQKIDKQKAIINENTSTRSSLEDIKSSVSSIDLTSSTPSILPRLDKYHKIWKDVENALKSYKDVLINEFKKQNRHSAEDVVQTLFEDLDKDDPVYIEKVNIELENIVEAVFEPTDDEQYRIGLLKEKEAEKKYKDFHKKHENSIRRERSSKNSKKRLNEKLEQAGYPQWANLSVNEIISNLISEIEKVDEVISTTEGEKNILDTQLVQLNKDKAQLQSTKSTIQSIPKDDNGKVTDENLRTSISEFQNLLNQYFEEWKTLRSSFGHQIRSWFQDEDKFMVEFVARGRFQKIGSRTIEAATLSAMGGNENVTFADYEFYTFNDDYQAKVKYKNLLNSLVAQDPDKKLGIDLTPELTGPEIILSPEENKTVLEMINDETPLTIDEKKLSADMKNFYENMLDGVLWYPTYKNRTEGTQLPAPRYCNVLASQPIEEEHAKDLPDPIYPNFYNVTLEDIIPQFRDALDLITDLIKMAKGSVESLVKAIDKIIKFIEDEIIPEIEELIKMVQDFVDLLKIGIVDAGIYFLHIPVEVGGTKRIRQLITSSKNRPPDNIDFTVGLMLLQGTAGEDSTKKGALEILGSFGIGQ